MFRHSAGQPGGHPGQAQGSSGSTSCPSSASWSSGAGVTSQTSSLRGSNSAAALRSSSPQQLSRGVVMASTGSTLEAGISRFAIRASSPRATSLPGVHGCGASSPPRLGGSAAVARSAPSSGLGLRQERSWFDAAATPAAASSGLESLSSDRRGGVEMTHTLSYASSSAASRPLCSARDSHTVSRAAGAGSPEAAASATSATSFFARLLGSGGTDSSTEEQLRQLQSANAELERKMDEDGKEFLEALVTLENEIEELRRENKQLSEERGMAEDYLRKQGTDGELRARNLKLERDCQDMLQQLDEFEREKDEELQALRRESDEMRRQLADQDRESKRKLGDLERERSNLIDAMTQEGIELQGRVDKLNRDKEVLSTELAQALARAAIPFGHGGGGSTSEAGFRELQEVKAQLRACIAERETLKDEVTTKDGQLVVLQSEVDTLKRKLRIADLALAQTSMLKIERELHPRGPSLSVAQQQAQPQANERPLSQQQPARPQQQPQQQPLIIKGLNGFAG